MWGSQTFANSERSVFFGTLFRKCIIRQLVNWVCIGCHELSKPRVFVFCLCIFIIFITIIINVVIVFIFFYLSLKDERISDFGGLDRALLQPYKG